MFFIIIFELNIAFLTKTFKYNLKIFMVHTTCAKQNCIAVVI
jgi:hypothetical protein